MARRFGAYEILHELSSGGMGDVLVGRRRGPGAFEQVVALKTIRPDFAGAPAVRAMFLDEAAIVARIHHPGIAAVHDFGEEGGTLYLAMEYVAGVSFRALLARRPPPGVIARAIAEACRGLHAAHEVRDAAGHVLGVVHRDISPDNLLLGFDGHVKVIDFGIALVRGRQAPVTELGTVKGKPPYMSPEQVKNESLDRRSDVFSIAVVLHELLTGRPVFSGDSIYAVARAVEHLELQPPSVWAGPLPPGLDAAVMAAMERDLARRTPTAAALAEQLEQVIAAAGDETLEAWAERELADEREAHRAWLAEIVAGRDAPRPIGRATGMVTQLPPEHAAALAGLAPPVGYAPTPIAPVPMQAPARKADDEGARRPAVDAGADEAERRPALDAGADDADAAELDEPPPRARRNPAVFLLLLLAAAVGGALLVMSFRRGGGAPDRGIAPPPRPDATVAIVAPPADAAPPDAAPPDAAPAPPPAPPIDAAAPILRARPDAAPTPRTAPDAGAVPPPDAAPAPATQSGTGLITIVGAGEQFFNILLDGAPFQVTPQLRKPIAAGTHTVVLLHPKTGAVVHRETVTVAPGAHVRVAAPPP